MADSELHYVTYDPDAIWDAMTDAYIEAGGDVLYGGDEKEILLRAVQEMFITAFAGVDNAMRMQTVRYAQGDYLKLLGEERGCTYLDATYAVGKLTLEFTAGYSGFTLEKGTTFTPDGTRFYALDSDVIYSGDALTVETTITCTQAGAAGNGVTAGTAMEAVQSYAAISAAYTSSATAHGTDAEDMEVYRERIRQAPYLSVTTGPAKQYRAHALAVSSDISDVVAERGNAGVVNVYLALNDTAVASDVIADVKEALSAEDIRPLTDTVNVQEADVLSYAIYAEYKLPTGSLTVNADTMQAAANEYKEWQESTIGRAFDPYQLIAELYRAGAERVIILNTSTVADNAFGYVAVNSHTRPRGTITLTEAVS